jgi:hypothetical protein
MVKIFGLLDLIATAILLGTPYGMPAAKVLVIGLAVYLILKAIIFFADIGSVFDVIGGVVLILSLNMVLPDFIFYIAAALVGFKGIMSLFA